MASSIYSASKLRVYPSTGSTISRVYGELEKWIAELSDGTKFESNYCFLIGKISNFKHFVLDKEEIRTLLVVAEEFDEEYSQKFKLECLSSLTNFTKHLPKKIYIRKITPTTGSGGDFMRVFTDDVLEIIPILLKRQSKMTQESEELLEKYKVKWVTKQNYVYNSIDVIKFGQVLDELNIDKSDITIIPDFLHLLTSDQMLREGSDRIVTLSQDGKQVMDIAQAVFYIFQHTVCGINLSLTDKCKVHSNCIEDYKKSVFCVMREFTELPEGSFVSKENLDEQIGKLKKHCTFTGQSNLPKRDYHQFSLNLDDTCSLLVYEEIIHFYGLPNPYQNSLSKESVKLKVWQGRLILMKSWVEHFFGNYNMDIKHLVLDALLCKVPLEERAEYELMHTREIRHDAFVTHNGSTQLFFNPPILRPCREHSMNRRTSHPEVLKIIEVRDEETIRQKNNEIAELKSKLIRLPTLEKKEIFLGELEKKSKNMEKQIEMLRINEKRLKSFEEKAKKSDALEKKVRSLEKEMETLRSGGNDEEMTKEAEGLKRKIQAMEQEIEHFHSMERNRTDNLENFSKKIENELEEKDREIEIMKAPSFRTISAFQNKAMIENEPAMMKPKMTDVERQLRESNAQLQFKNERLERDAKDNYSSKCIRLETILKKKESIIEKLQSENLRWSLENNSLRLGKSSKKNSKMQKKSIVLSPQEQLAEFQAIQKDFNGDEILKTAKDLIDKLSPDSDLLGRAKYELIQLEASIRVYLEILQLNIQQIEKTEACINLLPLPKYPSLSNKFLDDYRDEQEIDN
ncbi:hypothetical protein CRE_03056 [Caenorhabditis remanei]|uniref:Uncharacterized protein n=1 Tax=Caenorhabditis remanei TaxID=31234 RepID=E3LWC3_CAERE|nr:hypothetical protein CRE_03056 [Caenorhabditis remanei]